MYLIAVGGGEPKRQRDYPAFARHAELALAQAQRAEGNRLSRVFAQGNALFP